MTACSETVRRPEREQSITPDNADLVPSIFVKCDYQVLNRFGDVTYRRCRWRGVQKPRVLQPNRVPPFRSLGAIEPVQLLRTGLALARTTRVSARTPSTYRHRSSYYGDQQDLDRANRVAPLVQELLRRCPYTHHVLLGLPYLILP